MILELFSTVLIPVYSEWLSMDDLAHLDVAVCNTTARKRFVEQLTKCSVLPAMWSLPVKQKTMGWIYTRGMKFRGISIFNPKDLAVNKRLLCNEVEWLRASNCHILENALDHCSLIMALRLDSMKNESVIRLLPRLTSLRTLILISYSVSRQCMEAIVEWCPHLRVFNAYVDTAIVIRGCKELTEVQTILTSDAVEALVEANNLTSISLLSKDMLGSDGSDDENVSIDSDVKKTINVIISKPCLTSLSIDFPINNAVLVALADSCPLLTNFSVQGSEITDSGVVALSKCCHLQQLEITSTRITDHGVTQLVRGCPNLTVLCMDDSQYVSDIGLLNILRYCKKLKELRAYSLKFTDTAVMRVFSVHPSLEILSLMCDTCSSKSVIGNVFDMEYFTAEPCIVKFRRTLRSSQVYKFGFSKICNVAEWTAIFIQMPSLLKVNLHCLDISDDVVAALTSLCPLLTDVRVSQCDSVTEQSVAVLLRCCANLTKLTILHSKTAQGHFDLDTNPSRASPLTHLVLQHCSDSWILDVVAAMCPLLRSFDVTSKFVGNDALCRVIRSCPQLTHMNVSHCSQVDASVLQAICECVASGSRQWKSVNVEGCDGITKKDAAKYLTVLKNAGVELIF